MTIAVRLMGASDHGQWLRLREALHGASDDHAGEIDEFIAAAQMWGFIAEDENGAPLGFAEVAVRPYANGCDSRPVPFLEAIWVAPAFRRQGIGRQLIAYVSEFVHARGYRELGSDTQLDNTASHAAHAGWGFAETERVVYFRKKLAF